MLKLYHARETKTSPVDSLPSQTTVPGNTSGVSALIVTDQSDLSVGDDMEPCPFLHQGVHLRNSQALQVLPSELQHLTTEQQQNVVDLVSRFPCLFNDVPTQTNVLQHDIVVTNLWPLKQHPYHVNQIKRELMKKETEYLLQNGLAVSS